MIRFTLHGLLLAYTGAFMLAIFLAWWAQSLIRSHREKRAYRGIIRCRLCAHQFRDQTEDPLPKCPTCGARSERRIISRL